MEKLFVPQSGCKSAEYERLCACQQADTLDFKLKAALEDMWIVYEPYADKVFKKRLCTEYWSRIWEMSLAIALINCNYQLLNKVGMDGPDIQVQTDDQIINIEAVCPTAGDEGNPDSIPEPIPFFYQDIDFGRIEMRLQNAVSEKTFQFRKWKNNRTIREKDVNVIAISATQLPFANISFGYDIAMNLLRSMLPIGPEVAVFNIKTTSVEGYEWRQKEANTRKSGWELDKNFLLKKENGDISAFIYSVGKYPAILGKNSEALTLIKNPNAFNGLKTNFGMREVVVNITENGVSWSVR